MAFFDVYFSGPNISAPVRWELLDKPYVPEWLEAFKVDPDELNPVYSSFCSSDDECRFMWRWLMAEIHEDMELTMDNVVSIMNVFAGNGDIRPELFQTLKNIEFWMRSYARSSFEGDIRSDNAGIMVAKISKEVLPFKREYLEHMTTCVEYGDLVVTPNYADLDASRLTIDSSLNTLSRCGTPTSIPVGFDVDFSNIWTNIYGRLLELSLEHKQFVSATELKTIYKSTGVLPLGKLVSDIDFKSLKKITKILKVEVVE